MGIEGPAVHFMVDSGDQRRILFDVHVIADMNFNADGGGLGEGHVDFSSGIVHRAGDVLQIAGDLPPAAVGVLSAVDGQGQNRGKLDHSQGDGEKGGDQGKQDQTDEIQLKAGLKQPRKLPVQWGCLLS